jgi:hypothetical protein
MTRLSESRVFIAGVCRGFSGSVKYSVLRRAPRPSGAVRQLAARRDARLKSEHAASRSV